jgi:type VI secretion system secreted protein Hcp
MAVDLFLKIDGVAGESLDSKHKGEIELEAFSWGEANPAGHAGPGGGAGAGKVQVQDLHVTARVNKASPVLMLACASGKLLKEAVLTARKAAKSQVEFLVFKFTDLLVSSYQVGGTSEGDAPPMDQIAFNFSKVQMEYSPERPDGTLDQPIDVGWDIKQNKSI